MRVIPIMRPATLVHAPEPAPAGPVAGPGAACYIDPMRQAVVVTMVVVGVLGGAVGPARAEPPANAAGYAVFGIASVTVGAKGRVDGDVGCLFAELALGQGTRVSGSAAAPAIALRRRARANGGYYCGTITGTGDACAALPNPLIAGPEIVLAQPGNLDVSASRKTKATAPLSAGAYGALSVGTAAHVTLAGGSYEFDSVEVRSRGRVQCLAACDVTVRGAVRLGQAVRFGAADGVDPAGVVLRVAGAEAKTAVEVKSRAAVRGTVYAPSGDVRIGAGARIAGAIVGNDVVVGPRARLDGPAAGGAP
jgi:cytoskeletal protein CcmA (bactofilin family)